ncbi:MAG: HAMP domain-containing sensor histidine kinase [Candidatus Nitrosocosmicus sp.]
MKVWTRIFIILSTVALISLFITSTIAISAFSTAMTNEIIKHAEDAVFFIKNGISEAASHRFLNFKLFVNDRVLENTFTSETNNFSSIDKNKIGSILMKLNDDLDNVFSSFSIYDLKGKKLTSYNNSKNWINLGPDISNLSLFNKSILGKYVQDKKLWYSPMSRDYHVVLSAPVYNSVTNNISNKSAGTIEGVIVASYPINVLVEDILKSNPVKANNIFLLSNEGNIVYVAKTSSPIQGHSSSISSKYSVESKFTDQPIYSQTVDSKNQIESGIYPSTNQSESRSSLFVAAKDVVNYNSAGGNNNDLEVDDVEHLPGNLILVSELDTGIAFKEMFNLRIAFIVATFIIFAGITIVGLLASRSITKPLIKLKDSAIDITKGNLNNIIKPVSDDEIGELAKQFEKMRQSIKKYIENILEKEKELEKANKELVEDEHRKGQFISMISHELRTPLVPIKGYTEMLLRTEKLGSLNERQIKALKSIYRNIEKLGLLVEDVLDVYKLELGKLNLNKKEVDLSELFENVINDSKTLLEEKQITIISQINTTIDNKVYCDQKRIEQVLCNLIKNSIDFVPEHKGLIILRVDELNPLPSQSTSIGNLNSAIDGSNIDPYFVFTVQDNGKGIRESEINNLFKKFYQIDSSDTRKHGGTGLGLVICKGIIEAHGGKIWIDNNPKMPGASVKFTLHKLNFDPKIVDEKRIQG